MTLSGLNINTAMMDFFIDKVMAAESVIGEVTIPSPFGRYGNFNTEGRGLALFITNIIRLLFAVGGIVAFFNLIIAGFEYMTAAGDSKKLTAAWDRIWQSLLGLVLLVGSFALISFFGYLLFGDAGFILRPYIYGPESVTDPTESISI